MGYTSSDGRAASGDPDAIHDNVAAEIAAIAAKATPTSSDLIVIEDAADSNAKKRVTIGSLPAAAPAMQTVLDVDFTQQSSFDYLPGGDREVSFNSQFWDVAGTALSSQFEIISGTGMVMTRNAGAGLTGPYFSIPLYFASGSAMDQVPGWNLGRPWRLTIRFTIATGGFARWGLFGASAADPLSSGRRVGGTLNTTNGIFILDGIAPSFGGPVTVTAGSNVHVIQTRGPYEYEIGSGVWNGATGTLPDGDNGIPQAFRREQGNTLTSPPLTNDNVNLPASLRTSLQLYRLAFGVSDGGGTLTVQRIRVESE